MTDATVLDSWEDAGDNDAQLERRHRELLNRKKQEEQLARSKQQMAAAASMNQGASSSAGEGADPTAKGGPAEPPQPVVRILRRPQSSGQLNGQDQPANRSAQQSRPKTFEERQAAYAQARERIFGEKYEPDDDDGKDPSALDDRPRVLLGAPAPSPYGYVELRFLSTHDQSSRSLPFSTSFISRIISLNYPLIVKIKC